VQKREWQEFITPLEKVLIKLFQKFAQVEGAKPSSRPQARKLTTPFFWFFFCGYLLKKRTKTV
jgi:hypothetical protein